MNDCHNKDCLCPHPYHEPWECFTAEDCESEYEAFEREHPWLLRKENLLLAISEWWARVKNRISGKPAP